MFHKHFTQFSDCLFKKVLLPRSKKSAASSAPRTGGKLSLLRATTGTEKPFSFLLRLAPSPLRANKITDIGNRVHIAGLNHDALVP
jgi:hypothetical protein